MVINNYFNQLRQMFEADETAQDTTIKNNSDNSSQTDAGSIQDTNTQSADADWQGFKTSIDNFINQVSPLKEFFQSFVNTNSNRTDESGKNALNLANKYLNEAVDIEQTLNKAKQTISASTANELQTLKNAMDEAKKAAEAGGVILDNKSNNQIEEAPKNSTEEAEPPKDDNSSSKQGETSEQDKGEPEQNAAG